MIDNIIVAFYFVTVLAVGVWAARGVKSMEDFTTSRTGYGTAIIFTTILATYIGGPVAIGNAEKTYLFGIASVVALCGYSLKDIWVARFVAPKLSRFSGALSAGDIMATQYGRLGQLIVGVVSLVLACGLVGAQISATGYMFHYFFGLQHSIGIVIGLVLTIVYTTFGGLRSVIYTDILQFGILAICLPIACILAVSFTGGPQALASSIPPDHLSLPGTGFTWLTLTGVFLAFFWAGHLAPLTLKGYWQARRPGNRPAACFWQPSFPCLFSP